MPLVQVSLIEGRDPAVKQELISALIDAVTRSTGVGGERVRVVLYEVPREHWGGAVAAEGSAAG